MEVAINGLPPLADGEAVEHVRRVCAECRAYISARNDRQTERYLTSVWGVPLKRLGAAVAERIDLKRKVYSKLGADGRLIAGKMHANVTLAEELDVYVEIELQGDQVVILAAHGHYTGIRLSQ